jgi:hypothetical protein
MRRLRRMRRTSTICQQAHPICIGRSTEVGGIQLLRKHLAQDLSADEQLIVHATQGATQGQILATTIKFCGLARQAYVVRYRIKRSDDPSPEQEQSTAKGREPRP